MSGHRIDVHTHTFFKKAFQALAAHDYQLSTQRRL